MIRVFIPVMFVLIASFLFPQAGATGPKSKTKPIDLSTAPTSKNLGQYEEFVKTNAPSEDAFVAIQRIAEKFIQDGEWDKAADVFGNFRSYFKGMEKRFEKMSALLNAAKQDLIVTNLGEGINSPKYGEYKPNPSADGSYMFFTRAENPDNLGGEDIWVSEFSNGKWGKAENLGKIINTKGNESINAISADGNRILIFGNYSQSLGNGDIFYSDKTPEGWSKVKHIDEPVNSPDFESDAMITSDGNALIFTSDRKGGVGPYAEKGADELFHGDYWGNLDIYVSLREGDEWGKPINLGPTINTPFAERTAFLHPDGKTLYFSSDGHYGLGHLDVFKSVRLNENSWTEWSEPVNLGKEINTVSDDWGYKVATSGDLAYFSAVREGAYDLFSITLPAELRPDLVATIRGKVTDDKGNTLEADIVWEDLGTGKNVGQLKSDPQKGTYFIALPLGKNYGYYAEKKGYYPVSKNVDLSDKSKPLNITENIVLVSIEEMKARELSVRINNIFFDFNKFELKQESFTELNRLGKILKESDLKVEIGGHTDSRGSDKANLELSKKRAQSVVDYLVSVGVKKENLIAKGYGETKPVSVTDTEEGYAQNRRVEFKFVK